MKLVTKLRTDISRLRKHKLKHSFQDSLNPICRCSTDVESCLHFFLHWPLFQNEGLILLSIVKNIDSQLLDYSDLHLTQILLFGSKSLDVNTNSSILLTQPLTSLYPPRDLKNHFFKLPIFSTVQLLFFTEIYTVSFFLLYWYYFLEHYICFFFYLFLLCFF